MRGLLHRIASDEPGKPLETVESILEHLAAILNTERGDGHTHPELGVSLSELLARWPSSRADVLRELQATIEKHEPRMTEVRVETIPGESFRLAVMIFGRIEGRTMRIHTDLAPTGHVTVRECADPEGA